MGTRQVRVGVDPPPHGPARVGSHICGSVVGLQEIRSWLRHSGAGEVLALALQYPLWQIIILICYGGYDLSLLLVSLFISLKL